MFSLTLKKAKTIEEATYIMNIIFKSNFKFYKFENIFFVDLNKIFGPPMENFVFIILSFDTSFGWYFFIDDIKNNKKIYMSLHQQNSNNFIVTTTDPTYMRSFCNYIDNKLDRTVKIYDEDDIKNIKKIQKKCDNWLWSPRCKDESIGINPRIVLKNLKLDKFDKNLIDNPEYDQDELFDRLSVKYNLN